MSQAAAQPPVSEAPAFGLAAVDAEAAGLPFSLWGQFGRQARRYAVGLLLLAVYQYAQYWFDTRFSLAINFADQHQRDAALELGMLLVLVSLFAFGVRVLSR